MRTAYDNYKLVLTQEILKEYASDVLSNFVRYFIKNNISNKDKYNDTVILYWQLVDLQKNIVNCNDDADKLMQIQGFLMYIDQYANSLLNK